MAEQTRPTPGAELRLGDRTFTLRYTLRAMKEARAEFGGSITSIETIRQIDEEKFGKLLWYGLQLHHQDLTVEEIEDLVDPTQMPYIMGQYAIALNLALPQSPNALSPEEVLTKAEALMNRAETMMRDVKSTGSNSGASDDSTSGSPTVNSGSLPSESSTRSANASS